MYIVYFITIVIKRQCLKEYLLMATTTQTRLYKTGEKAEFSGNYDFVQYVDGTTTPAPTTNERTIYLTRGETFPPIHSCDKAAYWRLRS
jgi:hypothetical protein